MKRMLSVLLFLVFSLYYLKPVFAEDIENKIAPANYKEDKDWEFDASVSYETGDFGTDTTTNTTYIPLTLTRYFDAGNISGTLPYIYQESGAGVTAFGGRPFRTSERSGASRTASGLGDILLKGTYYVLNEDNSPLNVNTVGQIKFPAADDKKGLGTGEFDETLGVETGKNLNDFWGLFADFYYTFIGDPRGVDLNNEFAFDLGVGYKVTPPTVVSLAYEERTSLLDNKSNPRDLLFGVTHKINEALSLNGKINVGLSKGSPDFGITAGMGYNF